MPRHLSSLPARARCWRVRRLTTNTSSRRATPPAAGLRAEAQFVLGEMERRMAALGADWSRTTGVQVYTVFDIHPFLADEIVRRGAAMHGVTWQFAWPPIVGLDFEMDCRAVMTERLVEA